MALRPILILPDSRLRLVCEPIPKVDDALRQLMDDMVETMHDAPGIGLAASQIGILETNLEKTLDDAATAPSSVPPN